MNNATKIETKPTAEMIQAHMHLVHRIVAHFMRKLPRSVQREDLVSAGTLGLFYAIRTSGHTAEAQPDMFAAYARIRIRGGIVDELRRHDWAPRRRKETKVEAKAAPVTSIAPPSNVIDIRTRLSIVPPPSLPPPSLPPSAAATPVAVVGFDDLPSTVALKDEGDSPLELMEELHRSERVREALKALPEREARIIIMRYFEEIPSKTIAETLGLSEARISQLHARATERLKAILAESELDMAA
jgi:RNA polymerase sigma factor for flagellar operon FliA